MPEPQGLCQSGYAPASLWTSDKPGRRERAQQICRWCPLLDECRDRALHTFVLDPRTLVVVGGLTEKQLRVERKRLHLPAPRAPGPPPKARLISVTDVDWRVRRTQLAIAHRRGAGHRDPVDGCPRCERERA